MARRARPPQSPREDRLNLRPSVHPRVGVDERQIVETLPAPESVTASPPPPPSPPPHPSYLAP